MFSLCFSVLLLKWLALVTQDPISKAEHDSQPVLLLSVVHFQYFEEVRLMVQHLG